MQHKAGDAKSESGDQGRKLQGPRHQHLRLRSVASGHRFGNLRGLRREDGGGHGSGCCEGGQAGLRGGIPPGVEEGLLGPRIEGSPAHRRGARGGELPRDAVLGMVEREAGGFAPPPAEERAKNAPLRELLRPADGGAQLDEVKGEKGGVERSLGGPVGVDPGGPGLVDPVAPLDALLGEEQPDTEQVTHPGAGGDADRPAEPSERSPPELHLGGETVDARRRGLSEVVADFGNLGPTAAT